MQLEAKNVSFRYSKKKDWILKDVSFTVESGERVGIVAPSGFGKSTLSLLLAGYLKPTEGEILLNGVTLPKKVSVLCSSSTSIRKKPSTRAGA